MTGRAATFVRPARLLIVDDDADSRALLELILARDCHRVSIATCGHEALAAAIAHMPDLILLDVLMPDMSGYEVATQLRANATTKHIPILMLSAMNDRSTALRALDAGADAFLARPIDRRDLCRHVTELLALHPPKSSPEAPHEIVSNPQSSDTLQ